jgi:hypothetical protein
MKTTLTTKSLRRRLGALLVAGAVGATGLAAGMPGESQAAPPCWFNCTTPKADLVVSTPGQPMNQVTITNKGVKTASGFYVRIAWGGGTIEKSKHYIATLAPNESRTITSGYIGVYGNNRGVLVTADSTKVVPESDELNNDGEGYTIT